MILNLHHPQRSGCPEDPPPGGEEPRARWSVTDVETGELLASEDPDEYQRRVVAELGQQLLFERWEYGTTVVESPECWEVPVESDAARVVSMEVIPSEAPPPERLRSYMVPGQGYRVSLEVLGTGQVFLPPSDQCNGAVHNYRVIHIHIACGPRLECSWPQTCVDGVCALRECQYGCRSSEACVDGYCTPASSPDDDAGM